MVSSWVWEKGNHYYHDYHDYYDYFFVGLGTTDSIQMLFIHYSMIGNSKLLIKCFAEKSDSQAPICINKDEDVLLEHKIIFCCDCEITSLEQTLNYHAIDHHILKKTFLVCLISTLISRITRTVHMNTRGSRRTSLRRGWQWLCAQNPKCRYSI